MEPRVANKGTINTRNLLTIVSLGILVGTEIIGVALAAGWALSGLFELHLVFGRNIEFVLMGLFAAVGMYAMYRFMQKAIQVEPIRD
ncbi:hypothetical protein [Alsobacter sp. R-9]